VKRHLSLVAVVLVLATVAAAAEISDILQLRIVSKLWVGARSTMTSANAITRVLGASSSIDFGGVTDSCEDSSGITVTGALAGDACSVGTPATMPSATSWVTCYVSAADTVKVRHCSHGASGNPAAATYYVRVISSQ